LWFHVVVLLGEDLRNGNDTNIEIIYRRPGQLLPKEKALLERKLVTKFRIEFIVIPPTPLHETRALQPVLAAPF